MLMCRLADHVREITLNTASRTPGLLVFVPQRYYYFFAVKQG